MANTIQSSADLSLNEAKRIVADLFEPKPLLYWCDFLASITFGYFCFFWVRHVDAWWLSGLCFLGSCFAIYRAVLFTHELTHLREGTFRAFRVVWNLLCGIPCLLPSYAYYIHLAHHRGGDYGTERDGEYIQLGSGSPWKIVGYVLLALIVPPAAIFRFVVLTPVAWVVPPVRRWVDRHASSLVMDFTYRRPDPTPAERQTWRLQEAGTFLVWAVLVALVVVGVRPISWLVQVYCTGAFIIMLNQLRTAAAHRFTGRGERMTFTEQLVDSVNVPGVSPLTSLWAPVGLRYHALHHLFPSLPYHSLHEAHMRLMEQLPADSPYRLTVCSSLWRVFLELWQSASASARPAVDTLARANRELQHAADE